MPTTSTRTSNRIYNPTTISISAADAESCFQHPMDDSTAAAANATTAANPINCCGRQRRRSSTGISGFVAAIFNRRSSLLKQRRAQQQRLNNLKHNCCYAINDDHHLEEQISGLLKDNRRKSCQGILNADEEDEMTIVGYERSTIRTTLCWFCFILTFGLLRLIMHWWKHWLLLATHRQCSLEFAEKLLISEHYEGKHTVHYVKDVITLNADTLRQMKLEKDKYAEYLPLADNAHPGGKDYDPLQLAIHFSGGIFKTFESIRIFKCKQLRYVWDDQTGNFTKLQGLDVNVPSITLHQPKGLNASEQYARRLVYGANQIAIPIKSVMTLLFLEVLNPFYIFQVFSVCLWFAYNYYYYAVVIILMSAFGISMSIIQTRKNQNALYSTVMNSDCATVINETGQARTIDTKYLVPGDVLEIPSSGCTMQCDAVLLSGNAILDEALLTGESVPVTKTPLPCKRDLLFEHKEHARHVLYSGTKVIQTRYIGTEKVLAIVINTGNITAKGGLIRSILYPPPVDYKFEQDSYKFIMLLGVVAGIGFLYTLVTKIYRGVSAAKIAIEALDLITIAVPPALPAAMTVGRFYAQKRLKSNNIYCISPRSITVSGSIDCVCFDKTGTLTEDGLDMWGVVPKASTNYFQIPIRQVDRLPYDDFLFGMVTCHSITLMNGERKGDPLDLKMFESTGWQLEEANVADDTKYDLLFPTTVRPPKSAGFSLNTSGGGAVSGSTMTVITDGDLGLGNNGGGAGGGGADDSYSTGTAATAAGEMDIGIVREFSFTSSLQRMSVITRKITDTHFNVYCKGSPEMIITLCEPKTIPLDFDHMLNTFAQQGYRIIAIASKSLDKKMTYAKVQRISRERIESGLEFQGLVVMENRLKDDTTNIIGNLMAANIRTVMVTGDNILTALSVARDCEIITKGQSVITVDAVECDKMDEETGGYRLVYTLNGTPGRPTIQMTSELKYGGDDDKMAATAQKVSVTPNGMNGDYSLMTNSNSVASIETIDTTTQMSVLSNGGKVVNRGKLQNFDIECGDGKVKKTKYDYDDDEMEYNQLYDQYDELKLAPELPSNNYRFAMIGKTWQVVRDYYPDLLPKFITRGTVFARMSPDQKQSLILELQSLGYYVAMCGDGANDCGALKAAHTGISLSEAESSVASPFTSKNPTIACVPNIIKEGRAALVTSVGIFKYMAAYSLVQFVSVLILYSIDSNLTDIQFLYIDLCMISVFAFFFGKTESYDGPLVKQTPLSSLLSVSPIASLTLHILAAIAFQVCGWYHLHSQPWFVPFNYTEQEPEMSLGCTENYTIFIISCFQYIILAFVFSKGAPYRKAIVTNYGFLITLLGNICVSIYLAIYPIMSMASFFELHMPEDMQFRVYLVIYGLCNFILALVIEVLIVENLLFRKMRYRFHNIEKSRRKYLAIENNLRQQLAWPPLTLPTSLTQNNLNGAEKTETDVQKEVNSGTQNASADGADVYAEICVESGMDFGAPFHQSSSVLNSFFDQTDSGVEAPPPTYKQSEIQFAKRSASISSISSTASSHRDNAFDEQSNPKKRSSIRIQLFDGGAANPAPAAELSHNVENIAESTAINKFENS